MNTEEIKYHLNNNYLDGVSHNWEMMEALLSFLPLATFAINKKGEVVLWNKSMEHLTGVTAEEMLGKGDYAYAVPFYGYRTACLVDLILFADSELGEDIPGVSREGENSIVSEDFCPYLGASGMYIWAKASPLYNKQGELIGAVESLQDITTYKHAEKQELYLRFHDSLTGLFNRTYLEEEMEALEMERREPVSVIMADLNGLKLVNDTYGQEVGDEILKRAASVLNNSCGPGDIVARWGSDEFVILMPGVSEKEAKKICQKIKQKCDQVYVKDIPISISLGYSTKENTTKDLLTILKKAEDNMCQQKLAEDRSVWSNVLNAMLSALEEKSFETSEHVRHMQSIAQKIGERLGLSDLELSRLALLITLHDIGKINIPEEILSQKGPLNDEEWEIIKKHPGKGFRIAKSTNEFCHIAEEILCHHERWDGKGYPQGLKDEEIPILSRITAIADAYEVMSNGRPYKKPLSNGEIIAEFERCSGTQFDPQLVEIFLSILKEEGFHE